MASSPPPPSSNSVMVVGASNIDLIAYVDRHPNIGETIHGNSFESGFGGKGANQAVQAAKLGSKVFFVGKVGDDTFGTDMLRNLKDQGVDTKFTFVASSCSSGVAPIMVDAKGSNSIVIVNGANDLLTQDEIQSTKQVLESGEVKVLVCQCEIKLERTIEAMRLAKEAGVMTIFNPAPAPKDGSFPADVYTLPDCICPNVPELSLLANIPELQRMVDEDEDSVDLDLIKKAANVLLEKGCKVVLVTMGSKGAFYVTSSTSQHIPAPSVSAVDTTGAGDSFVGSLAAFLTMGLTWPVAIERAIQVASKSVQARGTQKSYPSRGDFSEEIFK